MLTATRDFAQSHPAETAVRGQHAHPRDLRIDLIRGIALLVIFVDHVPNNVLAWYTLHRFAFIDCADVFMFLSGYVSGLVFTTAFLRDGFAACCRKAVRRCSQLYLAHVLISGISFGVLYAYLRVGLALPGEQQLYTFASHPFWTVVHLALLEHMPYLLCILPVFVLFVGAAPLLAWGMTRRKLVVFLVPTALYLAAQVFSAFNLYWYPGHIPWGFNVFAWQLVFVIGFIFGNRTARGLRSLAWAKRSYVSAALLGLLAIVAVKIGPSPHVGQLLHTSALVRWIPAEVPLTDKYTAGPLRIVNLLLAALVVGQLNPRHRFWKQPLCRSFVVCGQNSLVVFCTGVGLCAAVCPLTAHFTSRWLALGLSVAGCVLLLVAGQVARQLKEFWPALEGWVCHWMGSKFVLIVRARGAA
jgi:hypothetical protein